MALRRLEIDYSAADAMRELSTLVMQMYGMSLDSKEKDRAHKLNILADDLRTASSDLRYEKKSLKQTKILYEDLFGKSNDANYTSQGPFVSDDVEKMYDYKIEEKESEIDFIQNDVSQMLKDISFIDRVRTALPTVSKALDRPLYLDPPDVTPAVLAPQLVTGSPEKIAKAEELIGSFFETRPEVVSAGALDVLNLLADKARAQAAGYEWTTAEKDRIIKERELAKTKATVASNLAFSPFVMSVDAIVKEEYSDEDQVEKIMALGAVYGADGEMILNIGSMLLPEGSPEEQYNFAVRAYTAMASFKKGSTVPKDITGLGRLVDGLKARYKDRTGSAGDINTPKGAYADWVYKMFNINMENIDQLYFEGYDPITKEPAQHKMSEITPEKALITWFTDSDLSQKEYLEQEGLKIGEVFKRKYKGKTNSELYQMILGVFPKKKSEKDVAMIREKLVNLGLEPVDVTADTGWYSVLAKGEARLRLVKPLADMVKEAKNILEGMGINLEVADTLVDYGVKEKQYQKWLAGGKKGPIVASPGISFHTIGFAFDLAQTHEMKDPEVARILESLGLVRSETEWWHWSLEEV